MSRSGLVSRSADELLAERWSAMKDGAGPEQMARTLGMIEMALLLGALSADQAELWERRVQTCPGHNDDGARDWCAYCGKLPSAYSLPDSFERS